MELLITELGVTCVTAALLVMVLNNGTSLLPAPGLHLMVSWKQNKCFLHNCTPLNVYIVMCLRSTSLNPPSTPPPCLYLYSFPCPSLYSSHLPLLLLLPLAPPTSPSLSNFLLSLKCSNITSKSTDSPELSKFPPPV